MRKTICLLFVVLSGPLAAQTGNSRIGQTTRTVFEGQPSTIRLAAHLSTTIRLPEPVNSVIVGDSSLFQAEYSPNEPLLVFAKPITVTPAESNLVISTAYGRQFILYLKSVGTIPADVDAGVDLLVNCRAAGVFFIEETFPTALISETLNLANLTVAGLGTSGVESNPAGPDLLRLDDLVRRQRQEPLRELHGDRVRVGAGQVLEDGSRLIVSF